MTPVQHRVVSVIAGFWAQHGHAPSYDEIVTIAGLRSKGHLSEMVGRLVQSGHLRRLPHRARSLEAVKTVTCPNCSHAFDPKQVRAD